MAYIEITTENYHAEVIESDKPVVLDFWAIWCGPCMSMAPSFEALSDEHPEIKFGKVNTDQQPMIAQNFQIRAIPHIAVMKDGRLVDQLTGAVPKEHLEAFILGALQ